MQNFGYAWRLERHEGGRPRHLECVLVVAFFGLLVLICNLGNFVSVQQVNNFNLIIVSSPLTINSD